MKQKKHIASTTTRAVTKKLTYFTDSGEAIEKTWGATDIKIEKQGDSRGI